MLNSQNNNFTIHYLINNYINVLNRNQVLLFNEKFIVILILFTKNLIFKFNMIEINSTIINLNNDNTRNLLAY